MLFDGFGLNAVEPDFSFSFAVCYSFGTVLVLVRCAPTSFLPAPGVQ